MGCNCGGNKQAFNYVWTAPDGAKKTFDTEVQARAAQIRNGGTWVRVPK